MPDGKRPEPRYAAIERRLGAALAQALLPRGAVLTEEPLARLFGTSRTPVRTALGVLARQGALARFDGRGFVVPGGEEPIRLRLTPAMLGLEEAAEEDPGRLASERIGRDFEIAVAGALPFGLHRVHEQEAADHYGVSRTVVRELLSRLQDRGIVRKDPRSHWVVGPLTARDVAHFFAIRERLEPLALADSGPRLPAAEVRRMRDALSAALDDLATLSADDVEALETDVHARLLAASPNDHLLRMIRQSQLALVVNRVFAGFVGAQPFGLALREHAIVLEFAARGAWDAAAEALAAHLRLSAARTRRRLMAISVFPVPELPGFLHRQPG